MLTDSFQTNTEFYQPPITGQYGGEFVQEISPWCGVVWYGMIGNWILGIGFKLSKTY